MLKNDEIILREFIRESLDKNSLLLKEGVREGIAAKGLGLAKDAANWVGRRPVVVLGVGGAAATYAIKNSLDSIHEDYRGLLKADLSVDVIQTGLDSVGYGMIASSVKSVKYMGWGLLFISSVAGVLHYLGLSERVFGKSFKRDEADWWGAVFSLLPLAAVGGSSLVAKRMDASSIKMRNLKKEERQVFSVLKLISDGEHAAALKQLEDIGEGSHNVGMFRFKNQADNLIKEAQGVARNASGVKVNVFNDDLLSDIPGLKFKVGADSQPLYDMDVGDIIKLDDHVKLHNNSDVYARKSGPNSVELFLEDPDGLPFAQMEVSLGDITLDVHVDADPAIDALLDKLMNASPHRRPIKDMFDNSNVFKTMDELTDKKISRLTIAIKTLDTRSRVTSLRGLDGLKEGDVIKNWEVFGKEGLTETKFWSINKETGTITLKITLMDTDLPGNVRWTVGEVLKSRSRFGIDMPVLSMTTPLRAEAQMGAMLYDDVALVVSPDRLTATVKIAIKGKLNDQEYKAFSSLLYHSRNGSVIDALSRTGIALGRDYTKDQQKDNVSGESN